MRVRLCVLCVAKDMLYRDEERITFKRFIHELARFRSSGEKDHQDALNSREAKLRCELSSKH